MRIMAGTDCIDIKPLHHHDVLFNSFHRNIMPGYIIMLMQVNTMYNNPFPIHQQLPVFKLNASEAHPGTC